MTTRPVTYGTMINTQLYNQFKVDPATTTGITFGLTTGLHVDGNTVTTVAAATIGLVDNSINIVTVDAVGFALGIGSGSIIYRVTTAGAAITVIEDFRGTFKSQVI